MKKLENKEMKLETAGDDSDKPKLSETERIIKDLDVNNLSPMQAFTILSDLNEKLRGKDE